MDERDQQQGKVPPALLREGTPASSSRLKSEASAGGSGEKVLCDSNS
jgi:hypothetical protein